MRGSEKRATERWAPVHPPSRLQARRGVAIAHRPPWEEREGPFLSLRVFLSLLVLNHPEDTSVLGLLLTCTRTFPKLNSHDANKAFSWIRPEMIAVWY